MSSSKDLVFEQTYVETVPAQAAATITKKRWGCSACDATFSDNWGARRHYATIHAIKATHEFRVCLTADDIGWEYRPEAYYFDDVDLFDLWCASYGIDGHNRLWRGANWYTIGSNCESIEYAFSLQELEERLQARLNATIKALRALREVPSK